MIAEGAFLASVGLAAYTYLGYPVLMWALARLRKTFVGEAEEFPYSTPHVSLLVAAYNESGIIAQKVENALSLQYPADRLEMLIGSDGSTDATVQVAASTLPASRGRVLQMARRGKSWVINDLAAAASGEILVFTDANTMFEADALRELVRPFGDPDIGCVSGLLHLAPISDDVGSKGESFYWKYETFKKTQENVFRAVAGANGAIFAVRKELYIPLSPKTINDDLTTSMRVYLQGKRMVLVSDARGHETTAPELAGEFERHIRDSAGHFRALLELAGMLDPRLGMPAFCFISHRVVRWLVPFFMIGAFLSSAILLDHPVYRWMFFVQVIAYAAFLAVTPWAFRGKGFGPFRVPYYFVLVNVAIVLGFARFLAGTQQSKWEPTARA
jgi:cellulose synthase/poly-beta-1,6-N-acetylglucosamine synthase-like glycosyltransferase